MNTSFHIITFGCQMNVKDSGWIAQELQSRGFTEATPETASCIIINTCSVREKPELKVRTALGRIRQITNNSLKVLVVVTGCVAQQLGEELFRYSPQVRLVAGGDAVPKIPDSIEDLLSHPAKKLCLTSFTSLYEERSFPEASATTSEFVNIMQGCDNFCTYCIVPYTRGRQKSRKSKAILEECQVLVNRGAREITLLGQNVNAYGLDKTGDGTSFAQLLRAVAKIPNLSRLRYVTPHPKDMGEEDVALFGEEDKLCPRLHLPMQAGANHVLHRMNRRYTAEDYLRLVQSLRKARPDIALSTDLIVGFPGETEEEFCETLALVRECKFMLSYSFCYSDRPGTRASLFPDKIAHEVQLDRLQRLQALQDELAIAWLSARVGQKTSVLIEQKSPRQEEKIKGKELWQGKDPYGALVHIPLEQGKDYAGLLLDVEINTAYKHCLQALPCFEKN